MVFEHEKVNLSVQFQKSDAGFQLENMFSSSNPQFLKGREESGGTHLVFKQRFSPYIKV